MLINYKNQKSSSKENEGILLRMEIGA